HQYMHGAEYTAEHRDHQLVETGQQHCPVRLIQLYTHLLQQLRQHLAETARQLLKRLTQCAQQYQGKHHTHRHRQQQYADPVVVLSQHNGQPGTAHYHQQRGEVSNDRPDHSRQQAPHENRHGVRQATAQYDQCHGRCTEPEQQWNGCGDRYGKGCFPATAHDVFSQTTHTYSVPLITGSGCLSTTVTVGVGQQSQVAGALDGNGQLTLVLGFCTGDAAGYDLAGFGDIGLQSVEILVIDLFYAFSGKTAELSATEKTCHGSVSF